MPLTPLWHVCAAHHGNGENDVRSCHRASPGLVSSYVDARCAIWGELGQTR